MPDQWLTLPDEILLLGWDDERGTNRYTSNLPMLVAGAAIIELVLDDKAEIVDKRLVATGSPTGHPALDLALDQIRDSRRRRTVKAWVQRLGSSRKLQKAVVRQLVDRGALAEEDKRILGLFPVTRHPVVDTDLVIGVRRRVGEVLTQAQPVNEPRDAVLASLVQPGGGRLLRQLVPSEQRSTARKRAKALSKGEAISADVAGAISEANAAMVAAISAATVAASSSSSN